MAVSGWRALVLCDRPAVNDRVALILREPDFDLRFVADAHSAVEAAQTLLFDMLVVVYPTDGLSVMEFLKKVRRGGSPCRHSLAVLLSEPETVEAARELLGRGVSQVLDLSESDDRLRAAVLEVLTYESRHPFRAELCIDGRDLGLHETLMTRTVNLSASGMLVEFDGPVVLGSRFFFSLVLPGESGPVQGVATVVRWTRATAEHEPGFAARFSTFVGDGEERFRSFISTLPLVRSRAGG